MEMDTSDLQESPVPENRPENQIEDRIEERIENQNEEHLKNRTSSDTRSLLEKGAYSGWQLFFLLRLESLLRLEEEYAARTEEDEDRAMRTNLLHRAVYSTYRDCIDLGVGPAAKRMFKLVKRPTGPRALKNG